MKTSCEKCVFAAYGEYPERTQVGCHLGRLDKFRERGAGVELREGEDGRKAYVIDRLCTAARKEPWGDNLPTMGMVLQVQKELSKLSALHVYVVADGAPFDDVVRTVDSLARQDTLPAYLHVVLNRRGQRLSDYIQKFYREYDALDWMWRVQALEVEADEGAALDIAVQDCREAFYAVVQPGRELPRDFTACFNRAVNEELHQFVAVEGDGLYVVPTKVHKDLGGNAPTDMVEGSPDDAGADDKQGVTVAGIVNKAKFLCEKVLRNNLILEANTVCPSL